MQTKEEPEELLYKIKEMRRKGHSYRSISSALGVSFTTISNVEKEGVETAAAVEPMVAVKEEPNRSKTPEDLEIERLRSLPVKEKRMEAYRLFGSGKRPDEAVYMVGLPPDEVNQLYRHFLESESLHDAAQLLKRRGHAGIKRLENIDNTLTSLGIRTATQAEKELAGAHQMYKGKVTLDQLRKEAAELKETKEHMLKEVEQLKPLLEKTKGAKEQLERIQREYPGVPASEIAIQEARLVLDQEYYVSKQGGINSEMFGIAIDAIAHALRASPVLAYVIWPEKLSSEDYEVYSRMHGGNVFIPEYNERSKSVLMQYALPYYRKMLLNRIASKSTPEPPRIR